MIPSWLKKSIASKKAPFCRFPNFRPERWNSNILKHQLRFTITAPRLSPRGCRGPSFCPQSAARLALVGFLLGGCTVVLLSYGSFCVVLCVVFMYFRFGWVLKLLGWKHEISKIVSLCASIKCLGWSWIGLWLSSLLGCRLPFLKRSGSLTSDSPAFLLSE